MSHIDLPYGEKLTDAEIRVLRLIFKGRTAQETSDFCGLSASTVRGHMNSVYRKLAAHNVAQARSRLEELSLLDRVMK